MPDEVVVQRRALLQRLGLSTSHYLKLQEPQGLGQAAQVDLEPLLNTAAICLMPDQWAYHWWQAPAAAKQLSPPRSLATGTRRATQPNAVDNIGSQAVPGLVEVKASAGVAHAERRVDNAAAERGLPLPVAFSETAASVSASTAPSAQEPVATSAPQPSPSPAADRSVRNSNDGSPFGCSPLHVQMQVLKSLRHLLTAKLDAIAGGSAKEDQLLAKQPGCSQAAVMALEYRAGQKDIASAALTSLAQKGTETVCLAAARLPAESSWVSTEGQVDAAEQVNKGPSCVTECMWQNMADVCLQSSVHTVYACLSGQKVVSVSCTIACLAGVKLIGRSISMTCYVVGHSGRK